MQLSERMRREKEVAERCLYSVRRLKEAYRLLRAVHLEMHYGDATLSLSTHLDIRDFFAGQARQDRIDFGEMVITDITQDPDDEIDNSGRSY